jgi:hypothetical protein
VTEEFRYDEEPNLPPTILSVPGWPQINTMHWVDSSTRSEFQLRVQVRDENVDQQLFAHIRIRRLADPTPRFREEEVLRNGMPVRDFDLFIDTTGLQQYECHRLELVVSGSFVRGFNQPLDFDRVPDGLSDDRAYASWTILEGEGSNTPDPEKLKIFNSCDAMENLLAPETVEGSAQ